MMIKKIPHGCFNNQSRHARTHVFSLLIYSPLDNTKKLHQCALIINYNFFCTLQILCGTFFLYFSLHSDTLTPSFLYIFYTEHSKEKKVKQKGEKRDKSRKKETRGKKNLFSKYNDSVFTTCAVVVMYFPFYSANWGCFFFQYEIEIIINYNKNVKGWILNLAK